ncbi:MAG: hypothetical protein L0Y54_08305, partial [Sporichthyaceae bacterium]|nr:hypothetical protein [Sporichthyaceae bacterium]
MYGNAYDTRWPRPGPVMVVIAATAGLVAGVLLGLTISAGGSPRAPSGSGSTPSGNPSATTSTTLPDEFWTVILASYQDRDRAPGLPPALTVR